MFRVIQQLVASLIYSSLLVPVHSPSECFVKQNTAVQVNQFTLCSFGNPGTLISSFFSTWLNVQYTMKLAIKTFLNLKALLSPAVLEGLLGSGQGLGVNRHGW